MISLILVIFKDVSYMFMEARTCMPIHQDTDKTIHIMHLIRLFHRITDKLRCAMMFIFMISLLSVWLEHDVLAQATGGLF